jgi:hypothetical protein
LRSYPKGVGSYLIRQNERRRALRAGVRVRGAL